jgi:sulfonate transport system ATP-binding protein
MHVLLRRLCDKHEPAVLLVTHDVDEAVVLANRVIVLDHGSIITEVSVDVDSPRHRTDKRFDHIRRELLGALGVEEPL